MAMLKRIAIAAAVLIALSGTAVAQEVCEPEQVDRGEEAYRGLDYRLALELLRPCAELGHGPSLSRVGDMFYYGLGVPQDHAEAVRLWHAAAEQGYAEAQIGLGFLYRDGLGVPQDYAEAVRWFRLAAGQGVAEAQRSMGGFYISDNYGVPIDYAEAIYWFRLAAEQGDARSQFALADLYQNSTFVGYDLVLAHMWLNIRSADGSSIAATRRDELATQMTSDQIAEAQRLAREWWEAHAN